MTLDPYSLRVLGALMEKEMTTPENYPLSLNSLLSACNQRSSRDPVLELTEEDVRQALHLLEDRGLVNPTRDSRVPKYEHRIRTVLNLRRDETALLCLLLLRGPQTPGELRSRADRLHTFDDLASVVSALERLAHRPAPSSDQPEGESSEGPLTLLLPRQPGAREARYAHLLGNPAALPSQTSSANEGRPSDEPPALQQEIAALEARVADLERRLQLFEARLNGTVPEVETNPGTPG